MSSILRFCFSCEYSTNFNKKTKKIRRAFWGQSIKKTADF